MRQHPWARLTALLIVSALLFGACAGTATPSPSQSTAPSSAQSSASTPPPSAGSPSPSTAACTGPTPDSLGAMPSSPVTLTMWVTADGIQKVSVEKVAKEYTAKHPNITIKVEEFPFLDLHDKLRVALQAGSGAPDVAYVEISRFGSLLKGSEPALVDLSCLLQPVTPNLIPARQNNYTYQGKVYGAEGCACPVELYYRADIFQQFGIATPIKTWDEYLADAKTIKAKSGKNMIAIETTDYDVWTPLMLQYGGGFFDKDGKVILDSPQNLKAFQWLVDLVQKYKVAIPAPGGDQYNPTFWGAYQKGDIVSIWGADWMASILTGFVPGMKGQWKAQPLPTGPDAPWATSTVGGTAMVITKQSANAAAGWDWMQFLYINRPPDTSAGTPGSLTNNKTFWADPAYHTGAPYFGGQKIGELWIDQANILFQPGAPYLNPDPNNPTAYDIFTRAALGPAIRGEKTAEEALKAAADELRSTVAP